MHFDDGDEWGDTHRLCAVTIARRVCGAEIAQRLMRDFGGTRVFFPRIARAGHPLVNSLGLRAARKLCDELSGCAVDIPLGDHSVVHMRRRIIKLGILCGIARNKLAPAAMCSERQVYNIAKSLRTAGELPAVRQTNHA